MLRRIAVLGLLAVPAAFVVDRMLAARRGSSPPAPIRTMVVIDAPIAEVWGIVTDIPFQLEWMREMKDVRLTTSGPTGVGTRAEATVRIAGIAVTDPVEVTVFEPPVRYGIRHEGLFSGAGEITFEPGVDGTTTIVRWSETLVPPLLPELGALVQAPILRWIFQGDLHRLRRLVETGSADG